MHSLASIHPDLFIQQFDLKTKTAKEQPNERDHIIAEATTYCLEDIDPTGFTHAQFSQFFERGINSGRFSLTSEALKMLGKFAKKHPASARQFYEQSLQDERAYVRNYTVSSLVDLAEVDPEAFLELYRKAASMYDGKANKDSLIPGLAAVVPLDESLYLRLYHEFLALEDEEHYEEDGIRYAYSPRKAEVAATVKELIQSNLQLAIELIEKGLRSENKAVRSGSASCIDYLFEKDKEAAIKLYELVGETSAETPGPSSLTGLSTVNPGKFVEHYKERLKSNPKETLSNLSLFWTLIGIDTQLAESIIRQYLPERNEEDLQIIPFLSLTLEEIFKASPRSYLRLYYELLGNSDYEYDASQSLKKVASAADLSSLKKLFDNLGIQPNEIFPACRFLLLRLSRNENLDGFVENIVHIRALNELRQRISDDQSIESWFKQAFEIEVEKLFAIGEVTAETVDSLALLLSYGIFPTEQLRKFMSEQGEAGLASLRELKEKTKSGALVPENRLQADLEFSEYLKLIGDSTKNTTYEDFTKLRFVTEDEEVLDLSMSERMEAEAAAFEAARLFWFIKERLDRGRKVHVVGNERYGSAFVVNPLRRHLEDVGVNISFYRIPSTSVSKDQASEKIFSYWFTNELIQNRPDVIIIDGTRTPYDEKGLPRLPRAMVGYLNWFIAFNKACGVLDVKIANHISALEKDITFKLVVATMSQMGARAAYKVAHWTATSHDQISYGGDLVTNYSAPGYDDAPHV
ncbi:MAG: hypothetical protein HYZ02_03070, partial [Candidatus Levybacteria bacterium]|nr:hypothetical protein [Candidatus Levybacteria bacterium]